MLLNLSAGYGRFKNQDYRLFLALLEETRTNNNEENKVGQNKYTVIYSLRRIFFTQEESVVNLFNSCSVSKLVEL